MGQPGGGGAGGDAAGFASFVPLVLKFAVFYFLLIRPQQKRTKEHKNMLDSLKRGDEVIAGGGIYGRIVECTDEYVLLDVGDAELKMARASVSALVNRGKSETPAKGKKSSGKGGSDKSGSDKSGSDKFDKKGGNGERKALAASGGNADASIADASPEDTDEVVVPADKNAESAVSLDKNAESAAPADK
jgi:preprotein translocase subunit YajC